MRVFRIFLHVQTSSQPTYVELCHHQIVEIVCFVCIIIFNCQVKLSGKVKFPYRRTHYERYVNSQR